MNFCISSTHFCIISCSALAVAMLTSLTCVCAAVWSLQGEEAEGDAGDGAAARQEHEQPAHVAVAHRGRAGQTCGVRRLPRGRDPEEAGRAAGEGVIVTKIQ